VTDNNSVMNDDGEPDK